VKMLLKVNRFQDMEEI